MTLFPRRLPTILLGIGLFTLGAIDAPAQQAPPAAPAQPSPQAGRGQRPEAPMDPQRARRLYVSDRFEDHSPADYARDMADKAAADRRYTDASKGVMDFKKITYRSSVGDLDIPAYLFQPLNRRGARGHAALLGSTAASTATGA